jgi:hypothetical protein
MHCVFFKPLSLLLVEQSGTQFVSVLDLGHKNEVKITCHPDTKG